MFPQFLRVQLEVFSIQDPHAVPPQLHIQIIQGRTGMEDAHHKGCDHRTGSQADGHQERNSSVLARRELNNGTGSHGVTARNEKNESSPRLKLYKQITC